MNNNRSVTQTGGRAATTGVIPGRFSLSVGMPTTPAPEGWYWTQLTDVARLESGHTPSRKRPDYWGGDVPWIGIKDATENHGRTIFDTHQHTNALGIANSSARILPTNTVCLSRTASVGYVIIMGCPMATSQDFVNWVCSTKINYKFLKHILMVDQESLLRYASGTTHQTIYFPEVKAFHVCLPPVSEQDAIAHILGSLDDKIEINRQMNETLEEMARTLFRSWFVDFDPVHAKADGRQPEGMDAETAALFPSDFVESELGMIPKGWSVKPIGDSVQTMGGGTPTTAESDYWEGGTIHWATPKDLSNLSSPVLLGTDRQITEAGLKQISSGLLPVGTVLLSSRAPIGYLVISEIPVAVNQGFIAMICNKLLPNYYVLHWTKANMEIIEGRANGSTFMEISKSAFRPIPALIPSSEILTAFVKYIGPLHRQIVQNLEETQSLTATRDELLPKLISGEVRLPAEMVTEFTK